MTWEQFKRDMEQAGVEDRDEILTIDVGQGGKLDVRRAERKDGKPQSWFEVYSS